jgi:hypothetical protein
VNQTSSHAKMARLWGRQLPQALPLGTSMSRFSADGIATVVTANVSG